jgi:hypothetical protein
MVRIFGFSWADAGMTTAARKKAIRKMACAKNGKTCRELPLLRSIRPSSVVVLALTYGHSSLLGPKATG